MLNPFIHLDEIIDRFVRVENEMTLFFHVYRAREFKQRNVKMASQDNPV